MGTAQPHPMPRSFDVDWVGRFVQRLEDLQPHVSEFIAIQYALDAYDGEMSKHRPEEAAEVLTRRITLIS